MLNSFLGCVFIAYWQLRAKRMLGSFWCWPPQGITLCFHFSSQQQVRASEARHHCPRSGSFAEAILLFGVMFHDWWLGSLRDIHLDIYVPTELPIKVLLMLLFTLYSFTSLKKLFRWLTTYLVSWLRYHIGSDMLGLSAVFEQTYNAVFSPLPPSAGKAPCWTLWKLPTSWDWLPWKSSVRLSTLCCHGSIPCPSSPYWWHLCIARWASLTPSSASTSLCWSNQRTNPNNCERAETNTPMGTGYLLVWGWCTRKHREGRDCY